MEIFKVIRTSVIYKTLELSVNKIGMQFYCARNFDVIKNTQFFHTINQVATEIAN